MSDSENKSFESNVTVLNEEYTRVLANPENIIVSDDLQQLLDIPLGAVDKQETFIDTMTLSVLDSDGLPVSAVGSFVGLSGSEKGYSVTITSTKIKQEFLQSLNSLVEDPGLLALSGQYNIEVQDCSVSSWLVTQTAPADLSLTIHFGSENGIF